MFTVGVNYNILFIMLIKIRYIVKHNVVDLDAVGSGSGIIFPESNPGLFLGTKVWPVLCRFFTLK
jgi:hypothetical protein